MSSRSGPAAFTLPGLILGEKMQYYDHTNLWHKPVSISGRLSVCLVAASLLLLSCTALTSEMAADPFLIINNLLLSVISLWNHQHHLDHPELQNHQTLLITRWPTAWVDGWLRTGRSGWGRSATDESKLSMRILWSTGSYGWRLNPLIAAWCSTFILMFSSVY